MKAPMTPLVQPILNKYLFGFGYMLARDLSGGHNNIISVIGDGAMSAGMAFEAMNNAGALNARMIVILNDNDMSIAPPSGALSRYFARLSSGRAYAGLRDMGKKVSSYLGQKADYAITRAGTCQRICNRRHTV